ncbi:MAG: ChaN family lipoprotein [Pyrinomonadaceae bacterium]|nr:ChaN family lipoprotein [Pyrinomonadaceae bacterium]
MKKAILLSILIMTISIASFAQQANPEHYRIYDSKGNAADIAAIITAVGKADAVFLGENHDDSVAHLLQFEIFKRAFEEYGTKRKIGLSLEMFERDVQIVLDEYLTDKITETHFLSSSRPWGNYKTDYRPLVEFAKEKKLPVVAANAPRRYVNMVSRLGRASLDGLEPTAKSWIAPLPFSSSSKEYSDKFNALMGGHGSENILDSQTLWDATMSYFVAEFLKKNEGALALHLNGAFHTESRLGTVEHFQRYMPKGRALVVTMRYVEDFKTFDATKYAGIGDFIILTDASQPKSSR